MQPTIGGSSHGNIALGSVSASMGKDAEESIESSMSVNGCGNQLDIALGSISATMGKDAEESIESSMSVNGCGNHELPRSNSSPLLDARNGENKLNGHFTPKSTLQAHANPNQATNSLSPTSYAVNSPAQDNPDENPQHPSICFQNHENPKFVIGLHRGTRRKTSKRGKCSKKQLKKFELSTTLFQIASWRKEAS
ncbi:hypothetical protein SLA2020_013010 [Shorea laevis]